MMGKMEAEEMLVELLKATSILEIEDCLYIAEYLNAHGVTVREMRKPIAETDLGKNLDKPVWLEEFGRNVEEIPLLLAGIGIYYAEFKKFGETVRLDRHLDDYNFNGAAGQKSPRRKKGRLRNGRNNAAD